MALLSSKVIQLATVSLVLMMGSASYGDMVIQSATTQANLIELYTSEGCSSCPPADRWLSGLTDHPALWDRLVPIAFHVDYWDYIGWEDRYAQPGFTQRQKHYARGKGLPTVYTPALMSNGKEWRNFRWRPPATIGERNAGSLIIKVATDELEIKFEPAQTLGADSLSVNVALLGFGLTSDVNAGENAGRMLSHDFVVLEYKVVRMHFDDGSYQATTPHPQRTANAEKYAYAFWVSKENEQTPLQAVGAWLDD